MKSGQQRSYTTLGVLALVGSLMFTYKNPRTRVALSKHLH